MCIGLFSWVAWFAGLQTCQTSTLAEAIAVAPAFEDSTCTVNSVDGTVFESRPTGSGSIVSELLLEVAIQLARALAYTPRTQAIKSLGTM